MSLLAIDTELEKCPCHRRTRGPNCPCHYRGQGKEKRLVSAGLEDQIVHVTRGQGKEKRIVSAGLEDQIVPVTH